MWRIQMSMHQSPQMWRSFARNILNELPHGYQEPYVSECGCICALEFPCLVFAWMTLNSLQKKCLAQSCWVLPLMFPLFNLQTQSLITEQSSFHNFLPLHNIWWNSNWIANCIKVSHDQAAQCIIDNNMPVVLTICAQTELEHKAMLLIV